MSAFSCALAERLENAAVARAAELMPRKFLREGCSKIDRSLVSSFMIDTFQIRDWLVVLAGIIISPALLRSCSERLPASALPRRSQFAIQGRASQPGSLCA